jgi:uncharacterized protein DUF932
MTTLIITEEQLKKKVPSVFSTVSHEKTSEKYSLIPTIECVRGLQKAGFHVTQAKESRCRNAENKPFSRHLLRFRHESTINLGGYVPEIVMLNSHDGLCSYQLRAGIYRHVCSNGLVVGNDTFFRRIKHQGDVISKVVESASEIIDIIPEAIGIAQDWQDIQLNEEQRRVYAESAAMLRWDQEKIPVKSERLLLPHRQEDTHHDLWTTFNVLQENLIKGGTRYYSIDDYGYRRGTTKAITSVNENSRLNTALWNLTAKMASLAK